MSPQSQQDHSDNSSLVRPLGVVLASSPNLHLWPLSRTQRPVQFVRDETGYSAFQRALIRVQKLSLAARPIVTVNAANLSLAREQMEALEFARQPHVIVEPVYRGNMPSLAIASLFAARYDRSAMMVVLDGHRPPENEQGFDHLIGQMRAAKLARNRIVVGVHPLRHNGFDQPLSLQVGAKIGTNHLFEASGQHVPDHLKTLERNGLLFTTPRIALQALSVANRTIVDACAMALNANPGDDNTIWPQINIWSSLQHADMDEALPSITEYLYLRPMDLGIKAPPHKTILSMDKTKLVELGNRLFVLQDCDELEIIASDDAALVRPRHSTTATKSAIDALSHGNLPHLHTDVSNKTLWGNENLIDRQFTYEIMQLTIAPGESLPEHFHNHRRETWTIAQGKAEASLDGAPLTLEAGSSLSIPEQTIHGLTNIGKTPLVVLETRHGDFLNSADFIRTTAKPPANVKIA